MLNTTQDFVIVIATVVCSLVFVLVLNRTWPPSQRRAHNELIGWQLSVLGTTYAVMMGFMLYTVWTNMGAADVNCEAEANALVNVFRLSEGLPEAQRVRLQQAARSYADVVLEQDFPAMADAFSGDLKSAPINTEMWRILMSVKGASPTELTAEDHALYELSDLTARRRIRQLQSMSRLPGVLWFVLLVGGVTTIVSSCMFGGSNGWLHTFQVSALALLIAMVLVAIADIDRPYQGGVHVADTPFRRAQSNMKN
jgi:hypothetical protein